MAFGIDDVTILAVKEGVQEVAKQGVKEVAKQGVKEVAKQGIKEISKQGVKEIAQKGVKELAKQGIKEIARTGANEILNDNPEILDVFNVLEEALRKINVLTSSVFELGDEMKTCISCIQKIGIENAKNSYLHDEPKNAEVLDMVGDIIDSVNAPQEISELKNDDGINQKSELQDDYDKLFMDEYETPFDEVILQEIINDYYDDLKEKTECSDTLPNDVPFSPEDLKKLDPEETAMKREEFNDIKNNLKKQWEEKYKQEWPKYDRDIYSEKGNKIREKGGDYDVHHIIPLSLGGENTLSNITPLNAEVHYDKQGIHSPDSPYSKMIDNI